MEDKIVSARITPLPKDFFDPMPQVHVTLKDKTEHFLFEYYPDEISFCPEEFVGMTLPQAKDLKRQKDLKFLRES